MYARLVHISLLPEAISQATDYFRQSVSPALKEHAGFLDGHFLVDEANNRCVMITFWESAQARTAAETNGFLQSVLQHMKTYFAAPPVIDYYDVPV